MVQALPRPGSSIMTVPSSWVEVHLLPPPLLVCHSMVVACMSRMCDFNSSVLCDVNRASLMSSDSGSEYVG